MAHVGTVEEMTGVFENWAEMARTRLNEFNSVLHVTRTIPRTPEALHLTDAHVFVHDLIYANRRRVMGHSWHSIDTVKLLALQLATNMKNVIYQSKTRRVDIQRWWNNTLLVRDLTADEDFEEWYRLPNTVHIVHLVYAPNGRGFDRKIGAAVRESFRKEMQLYLILGDARNTRDYEPYPDVPSCTHVRERLPTPELARWVISNNMVPNDDEDDPRPAPQMLDNAASDEEEEE